MRLIPGDEEEYIIFFRRPRSTTGIISVNIFHESILKKILF